MSLSKSLSSIQVLSGLILLSLGLHTGEFSLNFFLLFIYLLIMSFVRYRSISPTNIFHISWMTVCTGLAIYFDNFYFEVFFIALAPLSLLWNLFKQRTLRIFRWIHSLNSLLFLGSLGLFYIGEFKFAYTLAITALLMRQSQFPFHMWLHEVQISRTLYPSLVFFTTLQTGFLVYAKSFLHTYTSSILHQFIPTLTIGSGLLLAVYAIKNKDILTKHLMIIISQSSLPLAAYHSFSSTSATGGLMFAMVIALSGIVFGLLAFHIYTQKNITSLDEYHSLYRSNKNLAAIYFVCGFSLVGLPFTVGYFAEDILFHGLIETSTFLAPLYIVMTAINGYNVFLAFNRIFFGHTQKPISALYQTSFNRVLVTLSALLITFGVLGVGKLSESIEAKLEKSHMESIRMTKQFSPQKSISRRPTQFGALKKKII